MSETVKIDWVDKFGNADSGKFPTKLFMIWVTNDLGKTVRNVAKDFVEDYCGLEGKIHSITSISEVE